MDLYFKRHDGQAVTCDDFLAAMADANGQDLSSVARWSALRALRTQQLPCSHVHESSHIFACVLHLKCMLTLVSKSFTCSGSCKLASVQVMHEQNQEDLATQEYVQHVEVQDMHPSAHTLKTCFHKLTVAVFLGSLVETAFLHTLAALLTQTAHVAGISRPARPSLTCQPAMTPVHRLTPFTPSRALLPHQVTPASSPSCCPSLSPSLTRLASSSHSSSRSAR